MKVTKSNYGQYSSENYGANTICIQIGSLRFYFSYNTVVAFSENGLLRCSENVWSTTTGKHLNWIQPDKRCRIPYDKFQKQLDICLAHHNLDI